LPVRVEAGIYRIAQEAITNIIRHSNAQHATIQLILTPDQLQLEVEDDGQGFELAQVPKDRFGLTGMNERAKLLGGILCLESNPGGGTCVCVTLSL
jgi:two-component system, NarL family, sensor kinase